MRETCKANKLISILISLQFVPKSQINTIQVSVLITAWRWPGDKLTPELIVV